MTEKRPKKLELVFEKGGRLTATLMWDQAPKTCEAIVEALEEPVSSPLLHAQWAGSELYFEDFPTKREIPFENTTCHFDENYLLTNKIPGGVLAFFVNPAVRSFCMVYGEIIPRRRVDVEIALNIFAEIDDKSEAVRIGERSRWEGAGSVTIRILQG
ncbi:MAG: DUF3830 family protein [Anaerolineae bacterium]|nr:DUF3830 family protein [Anaerolineae bacterium]